MAHHNSMKELTAENAKSKKHSWFFPLCSLRLNLFGLSPRLGWLAIITLALLGGAGCATTHPLPPANLAEPGWTVRHGQAVWHLPQGNREIAGEVIVATRKDGESFVQFTKNPFPLVTAQATAKRWTVEFPPQNKHYAGRGAPPKRVIWLYLPRVLSGQPPPRHFSWHQDANGWKLENHKNGESLEGYFES
jgi:hypothetical protein